MAAKLVFLLLLASLASARLSTELVRNPQILPKPEECEGVFGELKPIIEGVVANPNVPLQMKALFSYKTIAWCVRYGRVCGESSQRFCREIFPIAHGILSDYYGIDRRMSMREWISTACGQLSYQVELRLKTPLPACSAAPCRIDYTVFASRFTADLENKLMFVQVGHLGGSRKILKEDSVLAIPPSLAIDHDEHISMGVKLYGLNLYGNGDDSPDEDLVWFDVTKVLAGLEHGISHTIETTKYELKMKAKLLHVISGKRNSPCGCAKKECGCCEHLDIPKLQINETGCVNITYLPHDYGFSFTFSLNGIVLYNDTISARNPPPVCFEIPHMKKYASLCLRFHNLDVSNKTVSGCILFEAELYHVRVYEHEMGCFHIPLLTSRRNAEFA